MMQTSLKTKLLAAAAVIGAVALAAGATNPATARGDVPHVVTIQLPNGQIEQIHYVGDVAPQVVLAPMPMMIAPPFFGSSGFEELERLSTIMDAQAASMLRQVTDMPALPRGVSGYSMVSTFSSNGGCVRSTQVTYTSGSERPKTVSSTSGDCGSNVPSTVPAEQIAPSTRPSHIPSTIQVNAAHPSRIQLAALDH